MANWPAGKAVFHPFTLKSTGGRLNELRTPCRICAAFDVRNAPAGHQPVFAVASAIWDTGATVSCISRDIVAAAGLKPVGMAMCHGVHGAQMVNRYLVNILLDNGVQFFQIAVTDGDLPSGTHALIGMDIITQGDFAITNEGGSTTFTFRVPSLHTIDYADQAKRHMASATPAPNNTGGGSVNPAHRKKRR